MKSLLDKVTFRLLIGQVLPGTMLAVTAWAGMTSVPREAATPWPELSLPDLWTTHMGPIVNLTGLTSYVGFFTVAVVLGLALQTTTTLAAANRESFRSMELDATNRWIPRDPDDVRTRSRARQGIARLWSEKPLWTLLPLAPLILLFDFFSMVVAQPRDLYKEIYMARADADIMEPLEAIISDYEYSADYFGNMSLALQAHFGTAVALLDLGSLVNLGYVAFVYALVSIHYISFRLVRTSIDQALDVAFSRQS